MRLLDELQDSFFPTLIEAMHVLRKGLLGHQVLDDNRAIGEYIAYLVSNSQEPVACSWFKSEWPRHHNLLFANRCLFLRAHNTKRVRVEAPSRSTRANKRPLRKLEKMLLTIDSSL